MNNFSVSTQSIKSNNIDDAIIELRLREDLVEAEKLHPGLIEAIATHIVILDEDFIYSREFPIKFWASEETDNA